jgi:hypothetical protein
VAMYTPIKRDGKAPTPTVSAAPKPFNEAIQCPDGVTLAVTGVSQGKVEGKGPGVFVGEPTTTIALRMTNRSEEAVSLNGVVVTMLYGADRLQARPVYDETARDFTGSVAPGDSATATYVFSVPKAQLGRVRMFVDFDGVHTYATFKGSIEGEQGTR